MSTMPACKSASYRASSIVFVDYLYWPADNNASHLANSNVSLTYL